MFCGYPDVPLYFHGIKEGKYRLPEIGTSPRKQLLCYGTSITHGAKLSGPHLTYPYMTAKRLGMDLINLGMAGTALCEPEMADYIANRSDWDIATLAMSVNMYAQKFPCDEFRERIHYMVNTIAKANSDKPIFCITLYPFSDDVGVFTEWSTRTAKDYRKALRDVVKDCPYENVHLLEGTEILKDFTLLAPDLIHPNDLGMMQMAENLSMKIKGYL